MSSEGNKQQLKKTGSGKRHINDAGRIGHVFLHQVHFIFIATL